MRQIARLHLATIVLAAAMSSGCMGHLFTINNPPPNIKPPPPGSVPIENEKITLPPHMIAPPDELFVEVLFPPKEPEKQAYSTALTPQPINGRFLVKYDGSIGLGVYGTAQVAGLTCDQARERIREFVAKQVDRRPDTLQVTVDVAGFNSQVYYVITDGAGFGEQVYSFPITGGETVLDAMARIGGIPSVGSKKHIWVARRSPCGGAEQILPVDWCATAMEGVTRTNYQILPGDRLYVQSQPIISIDNALAKFFSPIERTLGVVLLGSSTYNDLKGRNNGNGN